jgi:hypothetical protein
MNNQTEVLYNRCYGGFSISDEAVNELKKRLPNENITKTLFNFNRTHPVILEVYHLLGSERFSGKNARIEVEYINTKYKDHIRIREYDGVEDIEIDINSYKLYKIAEMINSTSLLESEKIKTILEENEDS